MSLRRVTFSGRFAQNESNAEESRTMIIAKGLFALTVDVGIALAVAFYALNMFVGKLAIPYERGFYCYEVPHISNPFRPNTISTKHLLAVSIASPLFIILLVEAVVFVISDGRNKLRKYFHFTTSIYLMYIVSFVIATFIMEVLKCAFARLRPHYLSVCQPNWKEINCTDPNAYIESVNCLGTNMHRIRIGRQSFPSGHTSAAVLLFLFFYFYLKGIVDATGNKLLRVIRFTVLIISGTWTVVVMVTRITDYWHYPTDVLGGIILALSCAYIFIRKTHSSLVIPVHWMACFDPDELADFIRYQCIINADDNGLCKKILRPPARKAKPGGLPLNFRSTDDSDTSSEEHSPCYLATPDYQSTYELLQERLRSRIQENDLSVQSDENKEIKNDAVKTQLSTSDLEFFQCDDRSCSSSPLPAKKSIIGLLLEKTDFVIRSDLAAYARFAASDIKNGRKLLVFYPFAESEPGSSKCFSLIIYAQCEICISDLVGLCCYEYARIRRTNSIESVTQYHLLMAEENGEVDRDLPAVDGHRLLNELGACWSTVALEKRQNLNYLGLTNVVVYTISGKQYEFSMDSLDVPLQWLRDQAIKRRIEDEGQDFMSDCPACSRGDFAPTCSSSLSQEHSSISKIEEHLISSLPERRKCSAIQKNGFELGPSHMDRIRRRNSIFLHFSMKTLCVAWDYVGGVEITDRSNSKRGIRIVWLSYPAINQSEALQTSKLSSSMQHSTLSCESDILTENYELSKRKPYDGACWKILQLEADVDDAWSIAEKINTIIDNINSTVRQIYKYSNGGIKKPKKAAAKAFSSVPDIQFKRQNSSVSPAIRTVSHLTATMTNAIPLLLKLLSKHN
ncbi:PAP2 family protein [Brugia pahangi]